jgi:hypothetical protein
VASPPIVVLAFLQICDANLIMGTWLAKLEATRFWPAACDDMCLASPVGSIPGTGGVPMVRETSNRLPDVVESGWSGRWLADNSRRLIASALIALTVGLAFAVLDAAHYRAQADGFRLLLRSSHSLAGVAATAMRVSSSTTALPADGAVRGKVVIATVDRMPGASAELLITAYISGGRARTRYALVGNDCMSNSADHSWASGVTNSQGIAVLTGHPWPADSSDYYWTWIQPSSGTTPPPGLHGSFAAGHATAFKPSRVPCAPYLPPQLRNDRQP